MIVMGTMFVRYYVHFLLVRLLLAFACVALCVQCNVCACHAVNKGNLLTLPVLYYTVESEYGGRNRTYLSS